MPSPKPRPSSDDRIRAALWFAERGFGVFPCWSTRSDGTCRCPEGKTCTSPGKHPITKDGFKSATGDTTRIRTFLSAASEPNYGLVAPEGVFILDVDGDGWQDRLARFEEQYGPLPATLRTTTGNGQHIYLRLPEGHPRPLGLFFGWIPRFGSGTRAGYVIGPRSWHSSGTEYRPADDSVFEIATLPDAWAAAWVAGAGEHQGVKTLHHGHFEPVSAGGRHDFLRDRARTLRGGGLGGQALLDAVMALNEEFCIPPKSLEEVERAIGDVERKYDPDPVGGHEAPAESFAASDDAGVPPPAEGGSFPKGPDEAAFHGLIGDCVRQMAIGTDASLAGLLGSFLAVTGAMVPARAYNRGTQTTSPFIALVGESSIGRKGTSMNRALDAARNAWGADKVNRVLLDGLNSGEALVAAMYFRRHDEERQHGDPVVALVFEEEYASMIASRSRDGSTLDPKMRTAFDGGPLSNRKANDSRVVPPPYWLPALAAITPTELRRLMKSGESQTGAANRWLYVPVVKRDILAPDIAPTFDIETTDALSKARGVGYQRTIRVADAVSRTLSEYGDFVIGASHGVALDLVKRYTTLAFRIALIHAALERSDMVTMDHLRRALALTEYARHGIAWVFGQTVGNRDADILLRYLQSEHRLSNRFISRHIIRDPIRRMDAIDELMRLGYAHTEAIPTRGRPRLELVITRRVTEVTEVTEGGWSEVTEVTEGGRSDPSVTYSFVTGVYTPSEDPPKPVTEGVIHAQNGVTKGVTEGAISARGDVSEGVTEGDRRGHPDPVIDHLTGEVMDATAGWAKPCSDYAAHQNDHRNRPDGWVCLACHPDEEKG